MATIERKNIVITGGSRGIGYEAARLFVEQGHRVWVLSRSEVGYSGIRWIGCDLSDHASVESAAMIIRSEVETVDILLHNSGYLVNSPFDSITPEQLVASYGVNVFGPFWLTQHLLPVLRGAHVVGISSMGGISGTAKFPGLAAYSSSKGAIIPLFELLQEELGASHVLSFNILALGAVQTEMLSAAFPDYQAPLSAFEMGKYVVDFCLKGYKYFKGKVLPVSVSTP